MPNKLVYANLNYSKLVRATAYSKALHNYFYVLKNNVEGETKQDTLKFLSQQSQKLDAIVNGIHYTNKPETHEDSNQ